MEIGRAKMRLIDADALKKEIVKRTPHFVHRIALAPCFDALRNAPTVDAVPVNEYRQVKFFNTEKIFEAFFPIKLNLDTINRIEIGDEKFVSVVRCGECRHKCGEHDGSICCDIENMWRDPNWFCAEGERREG